MCAEESGKLVANAAYYSKVFRPFDAEQDLMDCGIAVIRTDKICTFDPARLCELLAQSIDEQTFRRSVLFTEETNLRWMMSLGSSQPLPKRRKHRGIVLPDPACGCGMDRLRPGRRG